MTLLIPALQSLIAFQCLLFAAYLVAGRKLGPLANRINLGLLLVLAAHMLFNLINQHLMPDAWPPLSLGFGLLYGPLILLYIRSLIWRQFRWQRHHWLHVLPGLALCGLALGRWPPAWLAASATFFSLAIYLSLAIRALQGFRRVLVLTQSATDLMAMDWAWHLLRLNAAILLINMLSVGLQFSHGQTAGATLAEIALFVALLLLVSAFIFKGLMQPAIFAGISDEDQQIADATAGGPSIDPTRQGEILQNLLAHMESRKPHLDPLLSLSTLGRQLGETPRYVSQVINSNLGASFSDFINGYRIEQAKRCLADPADQRPILDILLDCGFSTKSNFNRVFKQREGLTPSEFRARALKDSAAASSSQ